MSSMHETPDPTPAGSPPPPAPPPPLPPAAGPRRFLRSREDRLIGGVAGGLGRTFGIDPVLFRIVFVALLFVGGVGVPLYLLTLLVTPSDDGTGRPAAGQSTGPPARAAPPPSPGWRSRRCAPRCSPPASPPGRPRRWRRLRRRHRHRPRPRARGRRLPRRGALADPPALLVALPAGVVSAADVDLDGGVGERSYRPASVADLRDGYELGVGELVLDLRRLDWQDGQRLDLPIDVGVGHAIVLVPRTSASVGRGDVGVGAINLFGRDTGGIDTEWQESDAGRGDNPRLVVDATIGVGALEVRHRRVDRFDGPGDSNWDEDFRERDVEVGRQREAADAACSGVPA
jgi:phage shock protein PspC (stress-responsive transcriptional regulator)